MHERNGDARAGAPDRMAESNGPAVDVETVSVEMKFAIAGEHLGGEGFIELDEIEVRELEDVLLLELANGWDWADAHDAWIDSSRSDGHDAGQRLEIILGREFSLARITAAAPSVMPEELAAVMVPDFEKTGESLAIFSGVASGEEMLVSRENGWAFLAFNRDRNDFASKRPAD